MATIEKETTLEQQAAAVLRNARRLLTDPNNWTRGVMSREVGEGRIAFCALGAIAHVLTVSADEPMYWIAAGMLGWAVMPEDERPHYVSCVGDFSELEDAVPRWNDPSERTHDEILAGFDTAIEMAERPNKPWEA